MTKRQLTEIEKRFSLKNLVILKADVEYIEKIQIAKKQLFLDTADIEIRKLKKDAELELKILQSKLDELKSSIRILEEQIRGGVEVKEVKRRNK